MTDNGRYELHAHIGTGSVVSKSGQNTFNEMESEASTAFCSTRDTIHEINMPFLVSPELNTECGVNSSINKMLRTGTSTVLKNQHNSSNDSASERNTVLGRTKGTINETNIPILVGQQVHNGFDTIAGTNRKAINVCNMPVTNRFDIVAGTNYKVITDCNMPVTNIPNSVITTDEMVQRTSISLIGVEEGRKINGEYTILKSQQSSSNKAVRGKSTFVGSTRGTTNELLGNNICTNNNSINDCNLVVINVGKGSIGSEEIVEWRSECLVSDEEVSKRSGKPKATNSNERTENVYTEKSDGSGNSNDLAIHNGASGLDSYSGTSRTVVINQQNLSIGGMRNAFGVKTGTCAASLNEKNIYTFGVPGGSLFSTNRSTTVNEEKTSCVVNREVITGVSTNALTSTMPMTSTMTMAIDESNAQVTIVPNVTTTAALTEERTSIFSVTDEGENIEYPETVRNASIIGDLMMGETSDALPTDGTRVAETTQDVTGQPDDQEENTSTHGIVAEDNFIGKVSIVSERIEETMFPNENTENEVALQLTEISGNKGDDNEEIETEPEMTDSIDSSRLGLFANACIMQSEDEEREKRLKNEEFVDTYMDSKFTYQLKFNFFEARPEIIDKEREVDESTLVPENERQSVEWCPTCITRFEEGEEVAVPTTCTHPHPMHIECFYDYFCGTRVRPSDEKTDTIAVVPPCTQCHGSRIGAWKVWKYSSTNTVGWKQKGAFLPENCRKVVGIHFHKSENEEFANFITDANLLYSIKSHFRMRDVIMQRPITLLNSEKARIFEEYFYLTRGEFVCNHCNTKHMGCWEECYLNNCNVGCKYRLCRDCVISRVISENKEDTIDKVKGNLKCNACGTFGRAYYVATKTVCFGFGRNRKNKKRRKLFN